MDDNGRYQGNIFVDRLWHTAKYDEVYLKAYASVLEAQRGWQTTSGSTAGSGPTRPRATGLRLKCSIGEQDVVEGDSMEGSVHRNRRPNH